ncbi:MAG: L,D-transpeptidase [Mycobacterium sp.]
MTPADSALPIDRRRALIVLATGVLAPGVLAGCFRPAEEEKPEETPPERPTLTLSPDTDATDVSPVAPIAASVSDGFFQKVALTNADGVAVAGSLNRDRTAFAIAEPLGYGAVYTWSGSVVGSDGSALPVAGSFTTVAPSVTVNGQFQLADGQTVGVAAPVILQFDASVADKASVERALSVTTDPPVEGGWAWLPDEVGGSRVHWRTKDYYPAGTTVRVDARLYGVSFGDGAFGSTDSSLDFIIGRRQVVLAEASSHRIQVVTDEGVIMDFPCSYGEGDLDRNVTRSGTHVVTETYEDFYMTNPAAGYANVREQFAVRISNNGEFIHANPASSGSQGNSNVTNGCINLSITDAEQYFNVAIYGDPVEVTGTRIQLSYEDGDIWDWAVSWDEWTSMSALNDNATPAGIPESAPATPTDAPVPEGQTGG